MISRSASRSFAPPSVLPDISPTRREIGPQHGLSQSPALQNESRKSGRPISPLVGEMSGRTEGGNVERRTLLKVEVVRP
jgi:precorrin-3B synthase